MPLLTHLARKQL